MRVRCIKYSHFWNMSYVFRFMEDNEIVYAEYYSFHNIKNIRQFSALATSLVEFSLFLFKIREISFWSKPVRVYFSVYIKSSPPPPICYAIIFHRLIFNIAEIFKGSTKKFFENLLIYFQSVNTVNVFHSSEIK